MLTIGGGSGYYLTSGYLPTFLKVATHTLPTVVSVIAGSPADLPMVLAIALVAISVIFLVGALIVPETMGRLNDED